ncbi:MULTISPECIES: hypothetical protein [unclassified Colwellia]|uniref:hypothetical protein n=1 Tax=unclassified Colwellia TaxID=196834 RepID=UPI0015F62358|nr:MULTISPECIES: hypothetical protein [unclassified Colwellia]MBA6357954.1 hypothetical protein [Colwellia sp. BRX8-3]MBA6361497.1 hypothetical protein [Colwellia sp. BRX8-6]MBA6367215.1 hypothetical protein [Colwellia sp. BRX8-5]MBA6377019.1 hypothetical protein [Colwellia sp. BRX8-2]MBA6399937.1 hypothetical protein [Colwellia sp. BRX10-4]
MNSKLLDYKLTFTLSILMMYPGVAFLLVSNQRIEKLLVFTLAVLIGGFLFYQSYNIFKSVQGFLKRFFISTFLVSGSLCIVAITPEAKNASAGAFLFLFIPSLFISIYLLYKSKPALKVKALYKRAYNKPLKQDK